MILTKGLLTHLTFKTFMLQHIASISAWSYLLLYKLKWLVNQ